jgi:hydrogenase expression/formation protein HypD
MIRVPGSRQGQTLAAARSRGAEIREVYSPLDALALARKQPDREVIGLAVGFETTAPATAAAVREAERLGLENLTFLTSFYRLAAGIQSLLASSRNGAAAVLVSGPVAAVTGLRPFVALAEQFRVPVIVTGPGPVDLLDALARAVEQLEAGGCTLQNQYTRAVRPEGNPQALASMASVFETGDALWRGLGMIPESGLTFRSQFRRFDARARFAHSPTAPLETSECCDGDVIAGRMKPVVCSAFGTRCTPTAPLGASMASAEGTCAAYFRFRQLPEVASRAAHPATSPSLANVPAPAIPGG